MTDNKFGLPITGGNTWSLYEQLRQLDSGIGDDNTLVWLLYLRTHAYFTNYFKVEGDEEFKKIAPLFMSSLWNYGQVAVVELGGKLNVLTISPQRTDGQGNVVSGNGWIAQWLNGINGMSVIGKGAPQVGKPFKLNDIDYAYAKWGNIALPAWWFWNVILRKQIDILNAVYTNISWLAKKMKYECYGTFTNETAMEILNSLNPKSGVVIENRHTLNKEGILQSNASAFTELKLPDKGSSEAWDYMSRYENFWNKYMGRVSHNYEKSSHNISNEMEVNNHNYIILEEDVLRQLNIFSEQLKDRLGVSVTFTPTVDLKAMDSEERKGDPGDANNLSKTNQSVPNK